MFSTTTARGGGEYHPELETHARELDATLDELRNVLRRSAPSGNSYAFGDDGRTERLRYCDHLVQQAKMARAAFVLELKMVEDEETRNFFRAALKERQAVMKALFADVEARKSELDRSALFAEAASLVIDDSQAASQQQLTLDVAQQKGDALQDKTQEAVGRISNMVAEAHEIGQATALKMDDQMGQMGAIHEGLEDAEYNIKRARATAKTIVKNLASDRCVQVLVTSIGVCVITIIILAATKN